MPYSTSRGMGLPLTKHQDRGYDAFLHLILERGSANSTFPRAGAVSAKSAASLTNSVSYGGPKQAAKPNQ